jgi:hypothetical protein
MWLYNQGRQETTNVGKGFSKFITNALGLSHRPMTLIANNTSGWMGKLEQASLLGWTWKNLRAYSLPCHGIFLIYSPIMWILLSDVKYFAMSRKYFVMWNNIIWQAMEYFATSHPWFVIKWTMAYWLWTWVWPRKSSKVASCKHLRALLLIEGCILSSFMQPMFQMSNAFGQ